MIFGENYYNILLEKFGNGIFRKEIEKAKNEFFKFSGIVHDDSVLYKARMDRFLSWYLLDRKLTDDEITPVIMHYNENLDTMTNEESEVFSNFIASINSLFVIKKVKKDGYKVKDIIYKKSYYISDDTYVTHLDKGDLFEARIFKYEKKYYSFPGWCLHPTESKKYIKSEVKKVRNLSKGYIEGLIMRLALMRLKIQEYPHIDINKIYTNNPIINF